MTKKNEKEKIMYPVFGVDLTGQQKEIWNDYVDCTEEKRGLDLDIEFIKVRERKGIPLSESETTDYLMGLLTQCQKRKEEGRKEREKETSKRFAQEK